METKVKRHQDIITELNEIYKEKNQKYGDSFNQTFGEYGPTSLCIRLQDKLNRLKPFVMDPHMEQGNETVVDTLMDLANYAIMGIIALEEQGYLPPTPPPSLPPSTEDNLEDYNKSELIAIAKELGIVGLTKKQPKEDLIIAIEVELEGKEKGLLEKVIEKIFI